MHRRLTVANKKGLESFTYLPLTGSIKVAQYYTKLPDKELLSAKLKKAIAIAREHYQETKDK